MKIIMCLPMKAVFLVTLEAFDVCLASVDSALVVCRVIGPFLQSSQWLCRYSCWAPPNCHEIAEGLVSVTFPVDCSKYLQYSTGCGRLSVNCCEMLLSPC